MFDALTALGYGIIIFAVLIGVGSVILYEFGTAVGGTANINIQYMLTQLGSGGLAGWTPAIIAISVGMLFLGMFLVGQGKKRSKKRR